MHTGPEANKKTDEMHRDLEASEPGLFLRHKEERKQKQLQKGIRAGERIMKRLGHTPTGRSADTKF